ncbi:MAG: tetratricopeptide repeat protein [Verrucomicrobiales bacterium]
MKAGRHLLVLALALLGPAFGAADIDQASQMFKAGNYVELVKWAEQAVLEEDSAEKWHALRIHGLLTVGRYADALEAVTQAQEKFPQSLSLRWLAREVFLANGQPAAAAKKVEELVQAMSIRSWAYRDAMSLVVFGKALLLEDTDPKLVLEKIFAVAQKVDAKAREPYLARGDLALEKHDFALAARAFREGIEQFPNDPDLLCGLARAYAGSDRNEMLKSLEAALRANPHHLRSLLEMADHQVDGEDYAGAAVQLDKVLAVNPHHPEAWAYHAVLAHLKSDASAEKSARSKALQFWPANPLVDHLIGRKLSQKYRFAEGAAHQRRALEFDPGFLRARAQLASDLLRLGDEDEGWKLAAEVHDEDAYDVAAFNLLALRDSMASGFATLKDDDFTVRMSQREAAIYGQQVLKLLGAARKKLSAKYGFEVARPTIVEIFPQPKDFGVRTFGMPDNPGYLGVCFGRVITANSPASRQGAPVNWQAVLWHEFCHVVTLQMTRNKMPRWLSEGISVYEERQANPAWGEHMTPQYREIILKGDDLTPLSRLSAAFLAPKSPLHLQFAYFESSLVVEFIIDRFGIGSLKAVLADLAEGREINQSLAKHVAPMDRLDPDFAVYARKLAEEMSPGLDWIKPAPDLLATAAENELEAWAKEHPFNYWVLIRQATRLIEEKKWAEAKIPLKSLAERYPGETGAESSWALLGTVHRELGEASEEIAVLNHLAEIDSANPEIYLRLMDLYAARGDWASVEREGQRYLAVNPLMPKPYRHLAEAAEKTGNVATAIEALKTLIVLDPPNPSEVHFQLARLLHQTGNPAARRHVLMALEDAPRHRAALSLLEQLAGDSAVNQSKGHGHPARGDEPVQPRGPEARAPLNAPTERTKSP